MFASVALLFESVRSLNKDNALEFIEQITESFPSIFCFAENPMFYTLLKASNYLGKDPFFPKLVDISLFLVHLSAKVMDMIEESTPKRQKAAKKQSLFKQFAMNCCFLLMIVIKPEFPADDIENTFSEFLMTLHQAVGERGLCSELSSKSSRFNL
jgi:hypothetical protein